MITEGRSRPRQTYEATGDAIDPVPIVVLTNRDTASASEIVTAALQENDLAKVVGTRTYGKGTFQEVIELEGGAALDLTVGEYLTADGTSILGKGVKPDVHVADDDPADGDQQLERGLEVVSGEIAAGGRRRQERRQVDGSPRRASPAGAGRARDRPPRPRRWSASRSSPAASRCRSPAAGSRSTRARSRSAGSTDRGAQPIADLGRADRARDVVAALLAERGVRPTFPKRLEAEAVSCGAGRADGAGHATRPALGADLHRRPRDRARLRRRRLGPPRGRRLPALDPHRRRLRPRAARERPRPRGARARELDLRARARRADAAAGAERRRLQPEPGRRAPRRDRRDRAQRRRRGALGELLPLADPLRRAARLRRARPDLRRPRAGARARRDAVAVARNAAQLLAEHRGQRRSP